MTGNFAAVRTRYRPFSSEALAIVSNLDRMLRRTAI